MNVLRWADYKLRRYKWWRKWIGAPEPMSPKMQEVTKEVLRVLAQSPLFGRNVDKDW